MGSKAVAPLAASLPVAEAPDGSQGEVADINDAKDSTDEGSSGRSAKQMEDRGDSGGSDAAADTGSRQAGDVMQGAASIALSSPA